MTNYSITQWKVHRAWDSSQHEVTFRQSRHLHPTTPRGSSVNRPKAWTRPQSPHADQQGLWRVPQFLSALSELGHYEKVAGALSLSLLLSYQCFLQLCVQGCSTGEYTTLGPLWHHSDVQSFTRYLI